MIHDNLAKAGIEADSDGQEWSVLLNAMMTGNSTPSSWAGAAACRRMIPTRNSSSDEIADTGDNSIHYSAKPATLRLTPLAAN